MHLITLGSETDFNGWRKAARALALGSVVPSDVTWTVQGHASGMVLSSDPLPPENEATFNVSAKFIELAQTAILHSDPERFAILYRLLWRLKADHDLLEIATDPDVAQVAAMANAVHPEAHRMHTTVRFRESGRERKITGGTWRKLLYLNHCLTMRHAGAAQGSR